jgi:hypothetical protein
VNRKKLKLIPYIRSWVQQELAKYAKQIGILEKDIPATVCTRKEVLEMPKELTQGRRIVTHKCFGICFRYAKTIFINIKMHGSSQELKYTIVHELVHYRFRYLSHGKEFEQRIKLILNDKKYPVKDLYPTTTHPCLEHDIQHLLVLAPTSREIACYEVADMHGISIDEIKKLIEKASTEQ